MDIIQGGIDWQKDRRLDTMEFNLQESIYYILEEVAEMRGFDSKTAKEVGKRMNEALEEIAEGLNVEYPSEHEIVDANNDICVFAEGNVLKLGYDVQSCREETLKEINSREGAWSDEKGKWIKDPEQDESTLYKADYTKYKIEQ